MYCHIGKVIYTIDRFSIILSLNRGIFKLYYYDGVIKEDWIYFEVVDNNNELTLKEQDLDEESCECIYYHPVRNFVIFESDSFNNDNALRHSRKDNIEFVTRIERFCYHKFDFVDVFHKGIKLTDRLGCGYICKEEEHLLSVFTIDQFICSERSELENLYEEFESVFDRVLQLDIKFIISQLKIEIKRGCFTRRGDPDSYLYINQINSLPELPNMLIDSWMYDFLELGEKSLYHEYDDSGNYKYANLKSHILDGVELKKWREKYLKTYNRRNHINGLAKHYITLIRRKYEDIEQLVYRKTRDLERSKWPLLNCEGYGRPELNKLFKKKSVETASIEDIKNEMVSILEETSEYLKYLDHDNWFD